jgi:hypothetical protein
LPGGIISNSIRSLDHRADLILSTKQANHPAPAPRRRQLDDQLMASEKATAARPRRSSAALRHAFCLLPIVEILAA